jgi:hypothetical protein
MITDMPAHQGAYWPETFPIASYLVVQGPISAGEIPLPEHVDGDRESSDQRRPILQDKATMQADKPRAAQKQINL